MTTELSVEIEKVWRFISIPIRLYMVASRLRDDCTFSAIEKERNRQPTMMHQLISLLISKQNVLICAGILLCNVHLRTTICNT
jgi:hypothetical protein